MTRLFQSYMFADYSGGSENHRVQRNISLHRSHQDGVPEVLVSESHRSSRRFSRDSLLDRYEQEFDLANQEGRRILFGYDHQYSWPANLWFAAGLAGMTWREAIVSLAEGATNRPALDIPRRFCGAFNEAVGQPIFWSPLQGIQTRYGIASVPFTNQHDRFRLTELVLPFLGTSRPKPADAVGGQGEGIVGGQTICGLRQIARILYRANVAWWPFDGLDINAQFYEGKHVGIEIYPSALRPLHIGQSDENDSRESCIYAMEADRDGRLAVLMNLSDAEPEVATRIRREGWILGMNKDAPRN